MTKDPEQVDRRGFMEKVSKTLLLSESIVLSPVPLFSQAKSAGKPSVCLFSKHLGWIRDYSELAETLADLGFDGVDLTVRSGGHVSPEKVEEELPKANAALKKAGVPIDMITTRIQNPRDPNTRQILRTAAALGIRRYRRDGEKWEGATNPLQRIANLQSQIRDLVELNKEYGLFAGIHNHSGFDLGATPWEVYELVKAHDPTRIGSNFDVAHATIEGGLGGWRSGFRLLAAESRIGMLAIKDFSWQKQGSQWRPEFCALGRGMVDFRTFFGYLKEIQFAGPISMHFEYGIHHQPTADQQPALLSDMRRDQALLRSWLKKAKLI
jgi:sugar phosphate isomerase/epimerase